MMKSVDIIYSKYLDDEHKTKTIGGVQTYITDLCGIIVGLGGRVRVVQFSKENFQFELTNSIRIEGFKVADNKNAVRNQELYDSAVRSRDEERVLTIFATDTIIPKKVTGTCLAIQHGVFWDISRAATHSLVRQVASRAVATYKIVKRLNTVDAVVCVDYNFLNWYRTQVNRVIENVTVIPNYTCIAPRFEKLSNRVNIIFARRLFDYRGTRVFTEAIKRLLNENKSVAVTVAGSGPDEGWMKRQLRQYKNVSFIHYESHESIKIHKDKHIAVVPTIGSEGTSLSLLEAMSAQCAVVCTNVGGMTNIVLDGYNGLMVNPGDSNQLYESIKKLVEDSKLRETIARNGYETVKHSFSYERWAKEWKKVLLRMKFNT